MAIGDRPALALGLVGGMMAANGKSGFLGALLAGFAAGYIILGLRKLCDKLPEALEKIAPCFDLSCSWNPCYGTPDDIYCRAGYGRYQHRSE